MVRRVVLVVREEPFDPRRVLGAELGRRVHGIVSFASTSRRSPIAHETGSVSWRRSSATSASSTGFRSRVATRKNRFSRLWPAEPVGGELRRRHGVARVLQERDRRLDHIPPRSNDTRERSRRSPSTRPSPRPRPARSGRAGFGDRRLRVLLFRRRMALARRPASTTSTSPVNASAGEHLGLVEEPRGLPSPRTWKSTKM